MADPRVFLVSPVARETCHCLIYYKTNISWLFNVYHNLIRTPEYRARMANDVSVGQS